MLLLLLSFDNPRHHGWEGMIELCKLALVYGLLVPFTIIAIITLWLFLIPILIDAAFKTNLTDKLWWLRDI